MYSEIQKIITGKAKKPRSMIERSWTESQIRAVSSKRYLEYLLVKNPCLAICS